MHAERSLSLGRGAGIPRVSVAVPVYNGEAFLREALDSVLAQTFSDFELVISDNASTDATPDICTEYRARDSRVRYLRNSVNIGAYPNVNRLVHLARAPYFKLANADDRAHPELLAGCVEVLDHHPAVVLCYGRTQLIDAWGNSLGDYDDNLDLRWPDPVARFAAVLDRIGLVNVDQGVMRTAALRRTGLLRSYPRADCDLVAELALHGQFWELTDRLFFRRMHAGASSAIKGPKEKQAFVDPAVSRGHSLGHCRAHLGYLSALVHAPLSLRQRLVLLRWVLRSIVSSRDEIGGELVQWARPSR